MKKRKSIFEEILWKLMKPPTILIVIGMVMFICAIIFNFDFFYWFIKLAKIIYVDGVIKLMGDIINAVIPK